MLPSVAAFEGCTENATSNKMEQIRFQDSFRASDEMTEQQEKKRC